MEKFLETLFCILFCIVYFFCKWNWENLDQILYFGFSEEEPKYTWEFWEIYEKWLRKNVRTNKKFNFHKECKKIVKNNKKWDKYVRNLRK